MCAPQFNNQIKCVSINNDINMNDTEQQYEPHIVIRFTFRQGKFNWNQLYKTLFWLCFILFCYLRKVYKF